jgi:hypothetical protein
MSKTKFKANQLVVVVSTIEGGCSCNNAKPGTIVKVLDDIEEENKYPFNVRLCNSGCTARASVDNVRALKPGTETLTAKKKFAASSTYSYARID